MSVSACVLLRSEHGKSNKVFQNIRRLKGVKRIFPVLGRYDVVIDAEASDQQTLESVVWKMGKMAGVVFTETLVEVKQKVK